MLGLISSAGNFGALVVLVMLILVSQPIHILVSAVVLRALGNSKSAVARWALHEAGRNRIIEIVRAVRDKPPP